MEAQLTVWALTALKQFQQKDTKPILKHETTDFNFEVHLLQDSLWILAKWNNGTNAAFRTAYAPDGLTIADTTQDGSAVSFKLKSITGSFTVDIQFLQEPQMLLHYIVKFKADKPLALPFWPKDVLTFVNGSDVNKSTGDIYVRQEGIRTGLMFAGYTGKTKGSFLYFQNLTAINDYFNVTETSAKDTVSGEWPEFGFSLPITHEKPFPADKEMVISDAFVSFRDDTPKDQFEISTQFLNHLASIYRLLPKPETKYQDYPHALKSAIQDLEVNKGCWSQHKGCSYLNAYVCDYTTPPEIMVQLAVLLPVWDFTDWSGQKLPFANQIYDNLHTFYNDEMKTIKRWLPSMEDQLDEAEPQKVRNVMDSWYLHHPLLNLGRMALKKDKKARELFLNSVDYAIKVAHHFNYVWPVFYNMETLEVVKQETQPGMGGEKDVAGVYAQVMLQAYDLTGEKRFYKEAEKAAQSLAQFGFDIFYQANDTAFSTKALLRLYKETGKKQYLDLCHLCVANLFKNMAIWECEYGFGKNFPLVFGLFPLNDAPYLAVYEEQECFAAIHDLLIMAEGTDFLDSARMLLAEFIRYFLNRAIFYYPPMLPEEMLSEEVKTGEIDKKLWVALEDIHDGWEKAGVVGQEVYGAGLCFGIVPRHYILIPDQPFMVYIDYPTSKKIIKDNTLSITVLGTKDMTCRLCVMKTGDGEMPKINIVAGNTEDQEVLQGTDMQQLPIGCNVHGEQTIIIRWTN